MSPASYLTNFGELTQGAISAPVHSMRFSWKCLFALLATLFSSSLSAEPPPSTSSLDVISNVATEADPINQERTIISPPPQTHPLRVAIYDGPGVGGDGVANVTKATQSIPGSSVTVLGPQEVGTTDLTTFDVVVFPGGSGSGQSKAIGEAGRANVVRFVANGGGYVGICAGAYLACSGFDWGLGLLNAKTVSSKWKRGRAYLDSELLPEGQSIFGSVDGCFQVRYVNGPVIQPDSKPHIAPYQPLILFRTEVAENDSPAGLMINSPAQAIGTFGEGRVFISSPHPEATPGLEHLIPRALLWAAGDDTSSTEQ